MTYSEIEKIVPDGLLYAINTVKGERHQDYERVVELAKLYHKVITGEGINTLLKIFSRREDAVMFQQRCEITQSITPAVVGPAMLPFYKVPRVNNIVDKIDFEKFEEDKYQRIITAMTNYFGEETLDDYMAGRFIELSFADPNAFIVTEFMNGEMDSNGNMIGHVRPYPIEFSAEQCVNFEYINNTLEWLVVTMCDKKMPNKTRYVTYLKEYSISFTPIDAKQFQGIAIGTYNDVAFPEEISPVYKATENDAYVIRLHNHKSKLVPATRVGYKRDLITKSRTCVSPIENGMSYLLKSIQGNSEMDLTMKLHAFLQKFVYEQPCSAPGCIGGQRTEGGNCKDCGGTGVWRPIHTTTQDSVSLAMPRDKDKMIPLSELIYYPQLQVELLRFQEEYTSGLIPKFNAAVFNSNVFTKNKVEFAAEVGVSMESVYDTLYPFAVKYAATRTYQVKVISNYVDIFDLQTSYSFPKDLRFRTREQLLSESAAAVSSPDYIKEGINAELAEVIFVDSPDELKRIRIKRQFMPFKDRTTAETVFIISNGHTTQYNAILWANFAVIFDAAEQAAYLLEGKPYLYDMNNDKIKELIDEQVDLLIQNIEPAQAPTFGGGA